MSKPITLYYKNVLQEIVGQDHGLTMDEINSYADQIRTISAKLNQERLPYRDLPYKDGIVEKINALVAEVQPQCENLVVLGIGGSALGNIALQTALNSPYYNLKENRSGPRLFVLDNVDPVQLADLLEYLGDKLDHTVFNVISKSGKTAETASQFLVILDLLAKKFSPEQLKERIVATTDTKSGTLRQVVDKMGLTSLEVPDGVGGRFSVLSDVGLFSAAMCSIDIDKLLEGARMMDKRVNNDELMNNPAALYAVIQYCFYKKGKPLSVMFPYSYQLKDLSDWYRQLWAESLGKEKDLDGNVVNVGPTPIKALGTTDQHSQVQLYREGPNDKIFTFLEVEQFSKEVAIGDAGDITDLSYLSGQAMSKLINSEKAATEYALIKSQRPSLTVRFPDVTPDTVGQFIYFFEVATSYMGELMNINTYDQPAVELGKIATFALMGHADHQDLLNEINGVCQLDSEYLL